MGRIIQLLRWVLPISAAILLANHFTPWLYRQLPNDYSRISLIIEALADNKANPESGVDGFLAAQSHKAWFPIALFLMAIAYYFLLPSNELPFIYFQF